MVDRHQRVSLLNRVPLGQTTFCRVLPARPPPAPRCTWLALPAVWCVRAFCACSAGPAHATFRDLDGSLLSGFGGGAGATVTPSTITGIFNAAAGGRAFPYDQGTPVLPGPCTYSGVYGSYSCVANSTAFSTPPLDLLQKPSPQPPKGIFGDPQLFVMESRDPDSEDRNFGPVLFNVSGSIDLVSAAMDHVGSSPGLGVGRAGYGILRRGIGFRHPVTAGCTSLRLHVDALHLALAWRNTAAASAAGAVAGGGRAAPLLLLQLLWHLLGAAGGQDG